VFFLFYIVVFLDLLFHSLTAFLNVSDDFCVFCDKCQNFCDDAKELLSEKQKLLETSYLILNSFDQIILLFEDSLKISSLCRVKFTQALLVLLQISQNFL
jgi:hypothetical protein